MIYYSWYLSLQLSLTYCPVRHYGWDSWLGPVSCWHTHTAWKVCLRQCAGKLRIIRCKMPPCNYPVAKPHFLCDICIHRCWMQLHENISFCIRRWLNNIQWLCWQHHLNLWDICQFGIQWYLVVRSKTFANTVYAMSLWFSDVMGVIELGLHWFR